jgi:hypothetical protein
VGLLGVGGAASRPGGILLGLPAFGEAAAVLAVLTLLCVSTRGACAAGLGVAWIPLLLLAGVPLPGLRPLSGPPLLALALGACVVVLRASGRRPARNLFFPAVLALYLGVSLRVQSQVGPEGDEPHYLMVADSLLRDGDLELERDYAEGRYRSFYRKGELAPHYRVRGKGGQIYSLHAVGLSVLVLPAYAVAGYTGASLFMALLGALLAREVRELARSGLGSDGLAEGIGWLVALSPPLLSYAGLVFTEVPAALLLAIALRRGIAPGGAGRALAAGVAVGLLPWLNVRYAPLGAVLVMGALWPWPGLKRAACLLAPALISCGALALHHLALYGSFDPSRVYGARPEVALALLPEGLQGLLLDQEFGLLVYAPVFVLAVPGLAGAGRASRRGALLWIALAAAVILPAASWPMWRGGFNPPARFLVPLLPVLALAVGSALRRGPTASAALLIGWGLWTGLAGALEPRLVHRDRDGTAPLFRAFAGAEEWTRLLPAYVLSEADRHRLSLVWATALALAASPWPSTRAQAGGLALAATGLLAAAGTASALSDGRTGGRDAVRVIGRAAVSVPGWRVLASAAGRWGPADLEWGPLYEPHRHAAGAVAGSRLPLPPGRYGLVLYAETFSSIAPEPPALEIRPEGTQAAGRARPFARSPEGWQASFEVAPGDRAVTLLIRGGAPFLLDAVELRPAQPFRPGAV